MSWTASATAINGDYKTFTDLSKIILKYSNMELENIKEYFNEFIEVTSLTFHKLEYKTQTITGTSAELDPEVISVLEVYIDAVRIYPISWEDLKEGNSSTQGYCIQNQTIHFNNAITTEVVTILCDVTRDYLVNLSASTVLDVPNSYVLLASYWILKEYYSTKTHFDETQAMRFERKYDNMRLTIYNNETFRESKEWMKQMQNYDFSISGGGSTVISTDY